MASKSPGTKSPTPWEMLSAPLKLLMQKKMGIAQWDNGFSVQKRRPWHEVTGLSDVEKRIPIPLRISSREEGRGQHLHFFCNGHLIGHLCWAPVRDSGGYLWVTLLLTPPKSLSTTGKQRLLGWMAMRLSEVILPGSISANSTWEKIKKDS